MQGCFSQAGRCWVALNIYPLEQSLRRLAGVFGAISSNREHIGVFVSMLKSLRFTFDHEELVSEAPKARRWGPVLELNNSALEMTCGCLIPQEAEMQLFQCHYQERGLMSGLYFDYVRDILHAAASQEASSLLCKPPPCLNLHPSPGALLILICISFFFLFF